MSAYSKDDRKADLKTIANIINDMAVPCGNKLGSKTQFISEEVMNSLCRQWIQQSKLLANTV
jgi:hypothetical protein